MHTDTSTEQTIDNLNRLLRGELSAVETYDQVLHTKDVAPARPDLAACHQTHRDRVQRLRHAVSELGGEPAADSGAWGAFAKMVEGGARTMGIKTAIAALEEGEDIGIKEYESVLDKLDTPWRRLASNELLPEQLHTHGTISALKRRMS